MHTGIAVRSVAVAAIAALSVAGAITVQAQRGGPGFPGGPGGPSAAEVALVDRFDANDDGWLNRAERDAARDSLTAQPQRGGRGGGRGGVAGRGGPTAPAEPGRAMTAADVTVYGDAPMYAPDVLRTFFIEFEADDWEAELAAFYNTDVEVPATVTVDGTAYPGVGIHFRGASSYFSVPAGRQRSLNLSFDFIDEDQSLGGYRTFNLLNSNDDPSRLRSVLYLTIANEYIPAPKANLVRVVINGEHWGVYPSAQQYNKDFLRDYFGTTDGARWKVPGSPNGRGGLEYLGTSVEEYRRLYEIKSKDSDASWQALIRLTRTLNETPLEDLEAALAPMLDIDNALRFLALDVVFANADGYWTRASDYSLYLGTDGRFRLIPHDANETFSARAGRGGGPGGRGGRGPGGPGGAGGATLDPLVGLDDSTKPLRSRLLTVPELRERYLGYVREIAERWLDWERLGPIVERYRTLVAADVRIETRALHDPASFDAGLVDLKRFADERRAFLLR